MYRLREMASDDKVCEQVSMTMLSEVYPTDVIERCQVIAQSSSMPSAFFRRYRLMAIDGTVFNTPETKANVLAGCRAAAINTGQAPIRRCAVCSWPSVVLIRWWG